jgi:hypothetical protein
MARSRRKKSVEAEVESSPKTTRPEANERREPEPRLDVGATHGQLLDAQPDRIDLRDWVYQPRLMPLPEVLIHCDRVPHILDQGREGACTGFALAAVIQFLLQAQGIARRVSPRMLYEMARCYDEWPGETYEGSSARGAMKGWVSHGVCTAESWPDERHGAEHFTQPLEDEGRLTPGGAYFRVDHRQIRDMHAALYEVGILYATIMVHAGWFQPGYSRIDPANPPSPDQRRIETIHYTQGLNPRERVFPVIQRVGRATGCHAIAIVGYNRLGFIVQNSWSPTWGEGGFALLPYEDYLLHATDVWVAQLGVPVAIDLWSRENQCDSPAGLQRAADAIPLSEIRPYAIDIGNNGRLSLSGDYWTTEADLERLFRSSIPQATRDWPRRRVLLYLHGGLNTERATASRVVAYRDVLMANEIYPLHIMWETGFAESLRSLLLDHFTDDDRASGPVRDWLHRFRDHLVEARDRSLELTVARPGRALWDEMKENAQLASKASDGGMRLVLKYVKAAIAKLSAAERRNWELHVVAHSAGSEFIAHALPILGEAGVPLKTLQLLAPAITVANFKNLVMPEIQAGQCPHPSLYILSASGERDDEVGPYGKSLLYLVSNAFEAPPSRERSRTGVPLLGMERFVSDSNRNQSPDEDFDVDPDLNALFRKKVDGLPSLIIAGRDQGPGCRSQSETHGGFDNDPATLNSILYRILGREPNVPFRMRGLQF